MANAINNEQQINSASKLKVVALNVRSIGKQPKRKDVLHFLKVKDPDLIIATETKIAKEIETTIRSEWDGEVFFSSLSSQARGVAIFKKKIPKT